MPGGGTALGFAYFGAVKLAGYTAAGYLIRKRLRTDRPHPAVFGAARTVLGVAVGVSFATFGLNLGLKQSEVAFYLAMLPVRLAEWLLILWWFFGRAGLKGARWVGYSAAGSVWAYLLDVPAIAAMFIIPGGAWIC